MALTLPLFRFDTVVLKNKSGSDAAQVPALGTFTFFRQGATVKSTTTLLPADPPMQRTLNVENTGMIAVGDSVRIGFNGPSFTVTAVTTPGSLKILYTEQTSMLVTAGTRLVAPEITPYKDVLGKSPLSAPYTSDATTGRFGCFISATRYDSQVVIAGSALRTYVDQFGGPVTSFPPYVSARDFASLEDAIAACPDDQETTISLEPGTYTRTTTLVIPPTKRIRLLGAGRDLTVLSCADPLVDVVWVQGNHCTLESLSVKGPGTIALGGQPEDSGRGVVVGRLGAGALPVQDFAMRGCHVHDTASWAVWFVGWEDAGGVPNNSLCLLSRLDRCELSGNQAHGLLRVRRGCTTLTFSGCALLHNKGYGACIENCEQVTILETVFEDSDDTRPYVEFGNAFSCAMTQCWFEHRGGWGELRDSNTQRFVRVKNFCRSTTLIGCHFVRNAGTVPPFTGRPHAIEISEDVSEHAADRARATAIIACEYQVPGMLDPLVVDDILIRAGCGVTVVGGLVQSSDVGGAPVYTAPRILETSPVATHGALSTIVGSGARLRVPRWRVADPNNPEADAWAAIPGDIRFDLDADRLAVMTAQGGWRRLALEP